MPGGVIFVRHAMPVVVPGVSSTLWRLGEAAKEDCVLLAHALPANLASPILSSGQPKTDETAAVIALRRGLEVSVDPRLRETDEPGWIDGDFRAVVAGYLRGDVPPGWEPHDSVVRRFAAAVDEARTALAPGLDLLVVTHGRAPSLYLASLASEVADQHGRRPFDLVPFWHGLTFPDAWRLDLRANTITRVFSAGQPPSDA